MYIYIYNKKITRVDITIVDKSNAYKSERLIKIFNKITIYLRKKDPITI